MASSSQSSAHFATTRWSMVLALRDGEGSPEEQRGALEKLCQTYWMPLYSYLRRGGHSVQDSEDLVQSLFESLLQRESLQHTDRARGKFRSFLLGALKHHLVDRHRRQSRVRRGAGVPSISLDTAYAEQCLGSGEGDQQRAFDRAWAIALVTQAQSQLEEEFTKAGREALFQAIQPYLFGKTPASPGSDASYAEIGDRVGLSPAAMTMAVKRMRGRFSQLLRRIVSDTVESGDEIEEELRYLLSIFAM